MKIKVFPVFFAFFVMGFGDVVGTLVGFAKETFQISSAAAGLLPFTGFIAFGLLSVPCGVLQDRTTKKVILLLGLGLALLGLVLPMIVISRYIFLIIAILLMGSGMAVLQVAGNPIMRDVSDETKFSRNLTFAQFIKSIGSLSGAFLTTLVVATWTGLFPIYAAVVALTIVMVAFMKVPKPVEEKQEKASLKSSFALLKRPYVFFMVLGLFLYVGAEVGMNSWIATYLHTQFGYDLESMATMGIGFFFTALMIGRLFGSVVLNWMSAKRFFLITAILSCLGVAGFMLGNQTVSVISIFVVGLGFANIFPLVFSILIEHLPERTNELSGLMVMAIVGGAIMPLVMGAIADVSIRASFLVPLVSLVFITITAVMTIRRESDA